MKPADLDLHCFKKMTLLKKKVMGRVCLLGYIWYVVFLTKCMTVDKSVFFSLIQILVVCNPKKHFYLDGSHP